MPTAPFGEWLPDQPALANPGATVALNVLPTEGAYRPWQRLAAITTALDAYCRGAIAIKDTAGNTIDYAGDATKLYVSDTNMWEDASKTGGYSLASSSGWLMTLWPSIALGQPQVFAVTYDEPIQAITVGDTNFDDLISGTLKPTARAMCVLNSPPFLMLGGTNDDEYGEKPTRVWWSHIGIPTLFDPNQEFECDFQDLPDSIGFIRALSPIGRGAIVFAEEALYRATYEGPPTVFGFSEIAGAIGCIAGGSVVKVGGLVYYLSRSGWRVTDGESSQSVGTGKVDRWTLDALDQASRHRISGAYDPTAQCVRWALPLRGNIGGLPNAMLVMHEPTKRWAYADQACELVFAAATPGYTLEALDAIFPGTLDDLPASLDDPIWVGGDKQIGGFTDEHELGVFTGDALTAVLETGEVTLGNGLVATVRSVRPLVDGGENILVAVAPRMTQGAVAAYEADGTLDDTGKACLRTTGRYLRTRVTIAGGFIQAMGVEADVVVRGAR